MADCRILIITNRDDVTADAVVGELTRRAAGEVVRLDTADFPGMLTLDARLTPEGWAGNLGGVAQLNLEAVGSVWWRRPGEFHLPPEWPDDARAFGASEARAGLLGVIGSLPVRWINHPAADAAANYKPRQLAEAARCGLAVPDTVITTDPDRAREFAARHGRVVYKALGGGVAREDGRRHGVPTTLVGCDDIDEAVASTATLLQQYVPKAFEVRLTVVGDRMFPVCIHAGTDATRLDWRTDYSALTYRTDEATPPFVARGVREFMARMGLFFGAFDFAVTPGGEWVFFEVNPSGQWYWLVRRTGVPLVQAMADALQEGIGG
ncbi:ATP-grasp ribosomal peptide maturase [Embleya sp. AB8]|uniref:ATP-grasp ribosomal peptide maturase n=1 Tax=Embleya sp. AB8 TaxID=3156304 RepID=UPI003C77FCBA